MIYIYMLLTSSSDMFSYLNTLEFSRITSSQLPWMQQNTSQWHENMAFETLETGIVKGTLLKPRLNKSLNRNESVLEYLSTNNFSHSLFNLYIPE